MRFATTAAVALTGFASIASAIPALSSSHFYTENAVHKRQDTQKKASELIAEVAPKSKDCSKPPVAGECSTAEEAAPFLINAMFAHGIYDHAAIAAVIALQSLESGEYQYNRNHYPEPGNPGQGSKNMQGIDFNILFCKDKPELASQLPEGTGKTMTDDQKNAVLALVMPNQYTFETAPWFLATQCEPAVLEKFKTDPDGAWMDYMKCVGVDGANEERMAYWKTAKTAFGIA